MAGEPVLRGANPGGSGARGLKGAGNMVNLARVEGLDEPLFIDTSEGERARLLVSESKNISGSRRALTSWCARSGAAPRSSRWRNR